MPKTPMLPYFTEKPLTDEEIQNKYPFYSAKNPYGKPNKTKLDYNFDGKTIVLDFSNIETILAEIHSLTTHLEPSYSKGRLNIYTRLGWEEPMTHNNYVIQQINECKEILFTLREEEIYDALSEIKLKKNGKFNKGCVGELYSFDEITNYYIRVINNEIQDMPLWFLPQLRLKALDESTVTLSMTNKPIPYTALLHYIEDTTEYDEYFANSRARYNEELEEKEQEQYRNIYS